MRQEQSASAELRRRAQQQLRERQTESGLARTVSDQQKLLHELQVHQLELEMQNAELHRAEGEAEAARARYVDLYDFAPVGYLTLTRNGAISAVNLTGAALLGIERSRLVGGRFGLLVGAESLPAFSAFLAKVFEGQARESCEVTLLKQGNSPFLARIEAMASGDGQECRVVVIDITERLLAEKELARSNAELEQFAYVVSHDLQEPLRMVASYVQLLEERYKDRLDKDAHEFIAYAVEGATNMKRMIADLLAYSRVGRDGKETVSVDCEAVLSQACANLRAPITETAAQIIHDPLPTVAGNTGQLTHLFQNLIGNAIKFRGQEPPRVHVSAERNGQGWVFSVRDNGIGLDPQFADRIFLVFQRLHTREDYPGTGIGLAIAKKIVEHRGGRIWVESEPGKGATFHFTVPERLPSGPPAGLDAV